jgi:hypothetical protein
MEPVAGRPDESAAFTEEEQARWVRIIKLSGARLEE